MRQPTRFIWNHRKTESNISTNSTKDIIEEENESAKKTKEDSGGQKNEVTEASADGKIGKTYTVN